MTVKEQWAYDLLLEYDIACKRKKLGQIIGELKRDRTTHKNPSIEFMHRKTKRINAECNAPQ
jgi:hypothetical protein